MNHYADRAVDFLSGAHFVDSTGRVAPAINLLAGSTRFVLPENGWACGPEQDAVTLWHQMHGAGIPVIHLPFLSVALQFNLGREHLPMCVLACHPKAWRGATADSGGDLGTLPEDAIIIFSFIASRVRGDKIWTPIPDCFAWVPSVAAGISDGTKDGMYLPVASYGFYNPTACGVSAQEWERMRESAFDEALTPVLELICALACKNVEMDRHEPDAKLNAARIRRGKRPLSAHYTLVLADDRAPLGPSGNGSHASPAMHVRRGHIRRLRSGFTWVRQCVVGRIKDGNVTKQYAIES